MKSLTLEEFAFEDINFSAEYRRLQNELSEAGNILLTLIDFQNLLLKTEGRVHPSFESTFCRFTEKHGIPKNYWLGREVSLEGVKDFFIKAWEKFLEILKKVANWFKSFFNKAEQELSFCKKEADRLFKKFKDDPKFDAAVGKTITVDPKLAKSCFSFLYAFTYRSTVDQICLMSIVTQSKELKEIEENFLSPLSEVLGKAFFSKTGKPLQWGEMVQNLETWNNATPTEKPPLFAQDYYSPANDTCYRLVCKTYGLNDWMGLSQVKLLHGCVPNEFFPYNRKDSFENPFVVTIADRKHLITYADFYVNNFYDQARSYLLEAKELRERFVTISTLLSVRKYTEATDFSKLLEESNSLLPLIMNATNYIGVIYNWTGTTVRTLAKDHIKVMELLEKACD